MKPETFSDIIRELAMEAIDDAKEPFEARIDFNRLTDVDKDRLLSAAMRENTYQARERFIYDGDLLGQAQELLYKIAADDRDHIEENFMFCSLGQLMRENAWTLIHARVDDELDVEIRCQLYNTEPHGRFLRNQIESENMYNSPL
jgi:hypothetical protein